MYLLTNQYIMKNSFLFLVTVLFLNVTYAQETDETDDIFADNYEVFSDSTSNYAIDKNIIKTNLSSIIFRNYSLHYERVITKRFSLSLSYRMMPKGALPLKKSILSFIEDDEVDNDIEDIINESKISGSAITFEPRFYIGKKGYGRGFYFAPYYRHSSFKFDNVGFSYESDDGFDRKIFIDGKINANSGGLMVGAQWDLGKGFVLDWWILGGHIGSSSGKLNGTSDTPLSSEEQQAIRESIESIEFSDMIKEITVDSNGVDVELDMPWYGVRAFGVSVGYRF